MPIKKLNAAAPEKLILRRQKLGTLFSSSPPDHDHLNYFDSSNDNSCRNSTDSFSSVSSGTSSNSPYSPRSEASPYAKSPWVNQFDHDLLTRDHDQENFLDLEAKQGLIGSLFREEGHVYSIAASGELLFTGSDSKNIRVWKNLKDFSGFKSSSGFVKAIVVLNDTVFTGHEDGKIRVWSCSGEKYTRVGHLPSTRDLITKSVNPKNYVRVRRKRNVPWIKHYDAVSCLSVDTDLGLLYSGSWDKTLKVWRISDFKCLESVYAHDDAVNSVVTGLGLVFTGSADGTVKAWRRELVGKSTKHVLVETLMKQDHAVTSLVVSHAAPGAVYVGTSDGLVSFWESGKHFMRYGGVLRGHKMGVLCLAAGGSLVMSGSADNSICVWRRSFNGAHTCAAVLKGHTGPVKCLTVEKEEMAEEEAADERWIVYSGSLDKTVKVWRV